MLVAAVTIIYAGFAFFEIISLKKTNKNKELVVFCIFILFAFVISILFVLDVKLPSFSRFVGDIVTAIFNE